MPQMNKKKSSSPARGAPKKMKTRKSTKADNGASSSAASVDTAVNDDLSMSDMLKLMLSKMEKTEEANAALRRDLDLVMARQNATTVAGPVLPVGEGGNSSLPHSSTTCIQQSPPQSSTAPNVPVLPDGEGSSATGTLSDQSVHSPPPAVCLKPIEVGHSVTDSMRAAILEGKYVCFKALLKNSDVRPHALFSVDFSRETISAVPSPGADSYTSSPISIIDWVAAWNIFSKMIIEHRGEAGLHASMAVHFDQVIELYKENGRWQFYDETFRRQVACGQVAWGQIHAQAQIKSFARPAATSSHSNFSRGANNKALFKKQDIPAGYCRDYNYSRCQRKSCNYFHGCCNCARTGHGASTCFSPISLPFHKPPVSFKPQLGSRTGAGVKVSNGRGAGGAGKGGN